MVRMTSLGRHSNHLLDILCRTPLPQERGRKTRLHPLRASSFITVNTTSATTYSTAELLAPVTEALSSVSGPAVTSYELGKLVCQKGTSRILREKKPKKYYDELLETLVSIRVLVPISGTNGFLLFGHSGAPITEVACCLDPFAYVSHLSAMEHHGLTDRFPKILYLTRPSTAEWRRQADARMEKDLGQDWEHYKNSGLPRLTMPSFAKLGSTTVHMQERSQLGAFRHVSGSALRVATIGRTFLDMLREPKLCGGIQHVLDIYQREAKRYLKLIVDEIDRHGQPIDKVRAGFVLTEFCHLEFDAAKQWEKNAQRGGSRKLDPEAEFAPTYSERWMISINVPSLTLPETDLNAS